MSEKIFIDTDCGIDDAVAIMLALSSPEVDVVGISCVAGNTSLDNVVNNVCGLLAFYRRTDIPVFRGCSTSLLGKTVNADHIHGSNGLGDIVLETAGKLPEKNNATEGLLTAAQINPGMKLITLGPLTNIAMAFNLYPELGDLISEIVIMGGAIGPGNITLYAEFNFYFDPEAVAFCLGLKPPIRILTWDATVEMTLTEKEFYDFNMSGTAAGDLFNDIQRFYIDFREREFGSRAISFPDPLTMACLIDSSAAVETEKMHLRMNLTREDGKRGASIRVSDTDEADGTADVIMKCDLTRFKKLIKRIKDKSPH